MEIGPMSLVSTSLFFPFVSSGGSQGNRLPRSKPPSRKASPYPEAPSPGLRCHRCQPGVALASAAPEGVPERASAWP